jgi:hypothetical protein
MSPKRIPERLQVWVDARMARELGVNPKKLVKLDNDDQEPWKLPLPAFIEIRLTGERTRRRASDDGQG